MEKEIDGVKAVFPEEMSEEEGEIRVREMLDETAAMAKAIVEAGIGLSEIFINSISLEDYYINLTGGNSNG